MAGDLPLDSRGLGAGNHAIGPINLDCLCGSLRGIGRQ